MSFRGPGRPNATSGMGVADHSKNTFVELKMKKAHRYVIFKIDEKKKEVVVEKTGGPAESFNDFSAALPDNDCRYAVYDFDFVTSENCQKSKIFFIAWSPDTARVRAKMVYASSKEQFRRELDGIHYEIQATDPTEMGLEVFGARAYETQATDPTKKDLVMIRDRANGSSSISVVGCSSYYEEDEDKDDDDTVTIVYE